MVRAPCCEEIMGLKKGPWTVEEDRILINYITAYGHTNWRALPRRAGLLRCGKSCRLRWTNYLRPDIKRGNFTREEEDAIIHLHETMGNRWSAIAAKLPGRTDNEIKNVWHTHLKRRLKQKPRDEATDTRRNPKENSILNMDLIKGGRDLTSTVSNMIDTECQEARQPVRSPRHSANEDIMSSSITMTSDDVNNENKNSSSSSTCCTSSMDITGELPEVDESFWTELLKSVDSADHQISFDVVGAFSAMDNIDDELQWQYPRTQPIGAQVTPEYANDNMDFWLDIFTRAEEFTISGSNPNKMDEHMRTNWL